jgi:hypothetical protein
VASAGKSGHLQTPLNMCFAMAFIVIFKSSQGKECARLDFYKVNRLSNQQPEQP